MLNFRSFTKEDWNGFAGAHGFADGREPQIAECAIEDLPAVVIHDATGVEILWEVGDVQRSVRVSHEALSVLEERISFDDLVDLPGFTNLI